MISLLITFDQFVEVVGLTVIYTKFGQSRKNLRYSLRYSLASCHQTLICKTITVLSINTIQSKLNLVKIGPMVRKSRFSKKYKTANVQNGLYGKIMYRLTWHAETESNEI